MLPLQGATKGDSLFGELRPRKPCGVAEEKNPKNLKLYTLKRLWTFSERPRPMVSEAQTGFGPWPQDEYSRLRRRERCGVNRGWSPFFPLMHLKAGPRRKKATAKRHFTKMPMCRALVGTTGIVTSSCGHIHGHHYLTRVIPHKIFRVGPRVTFTSLFKYQTYLGILRLSGQHLHTPSE